MTTEKNTAEADLAFLRGLVSSDNDAGWRQAFGRAYALWGFAFLVPLLIEWTRLIGLICVAVCLVIAWYGFEVTIQNFVQNEKDVRSLDMPRWMVVGWIPVSFLMMAIEFARFLWKRENFLQPLSELNT